MSTEQKLARLRSDLPLFADKCLRIKSKSGEIVPLAFNRVQIFLHQKLDEQKRRTGKVRAIVLKGRQNGCSTYIGARYYHRVSLNPGVGAYILTHEQAATDVLFDMIERYFKNCPLKPSTGAANAKELFFDLLDSGYSVGTAGAKATGRSRTLSLFHGSEVAYWPNPRDHFAGVVQGVPDLPGTEIVLESTGHGVGGEFYERWQMAEAGQGDYAAIFIPWYWSEEYRRAVLADFMITDEEREESRLYGLSLEQLATNFGPVRARAHSKPTR